MSIKKAFTLIELLIVIAIIGILATLIFVNVNTARKKARDAKRMADLKNLQTAVEMYSQDIGSIPTTGGVWWRYDGTHSNTGPTAWIPGLAPEYVNVLPVAPSFTTSTGPHYYGYRSNGTDYKIRACLIEGTNSDPSFVDPFMNTCYSIASSDAVNRAW